MYIPVPGLGDSAYLRTVFSFNDNKLINNRRIDPKFNISKTKQKTQTSEKQISMLAIHRQYDGPTCNIH